MKDISKDIFFILIVSIIDQLQASMSRKSARAPHEKTASRNPGPFENVDGKLLSGSSADREE
jgi:hypothetical protein